MVWGGWSGHEPKETVARFAPFLQESGFEVRIEDNLDVYTDEAYMSSLSLVVPIWTMGNMSSEQEKGLMQTTEDELAPVSGKRRGMLFIFPDVAMHGMWMMNTFVPLSVAFIDREGRIINIEDMQPQTTNTHSASKPAKYALEMNLGWFAKRNIKPGTKIEGLDKAGAAR